ncbi:GSU2403 family nucleotidyltransferase fold protein [Pseudovibrio japonicus]|uniref:GSU2403 family nucleotidyltransferase fold protein n=1 Tax=Pseudovibrio japonicus TaxID=366534 RepID=UPI00167906BA|nr:GSU2403 family nucleotidyltransferase fold protein [Pseudovibrio japonicus]
MTDLPLAYQNLAADYIQKTHDDSRALRGSVYQQAKGNVENVFVKMPVGAGRKSLYVGPALQSETQAKVEQIKQASERARARRKDLSVLNKVGILSTHSYAGRVMDAMAYHGLFRNGAILVGTLAYQCYPLLLGCTLPSTQLATDDADLVAASLAIKADEGIDMLSILKDADPSFEPIPELDGRAKPSRFRSRIGFVVDLLTPTRKRGEKQPLALQGLDAGAMSLQYLAWLIDGSVPAALPFGAGIAVYVPRPERYAVHKLIISQKRAHTATKVTKDLAQAKALIEVIERTRPGLIGDELLDAQSQGKQGWSEPIVKAMKALWPDGSWQERPEFEDFVEGL